MIILRQKEYTSVGSLQTRKAASNGLDIGASSRYKERFENWGSIPDEEKELLKQAVKDIRDSSSSRRNYRKNKGIERTKSGLLNFDIRHGDELVDDAGRFTTESYVSSKDTSYRDAYRDFLRNEKKIFDKEEPKVDPQTRRYRPNLKKGAIKYTNEDIKNEIRKLARKEGIKRWTKDHKGAIIGGTIGTATLVSGGAYLIHKHRKNKRAKEKENESKESKT